MPCRGIQTKTKRRLTPARSCERLARGNKSLKEFNFFSLRQEASKKAKFEEPTDYYLEYKDADADAAFHLMLKTREAPETGAATCWIRSSSIDFTFVDKDPVKLVGAPAACQMTFQRPSDGTASDRSSANRIS